MTTAIPVSCPTCGALFASRAFRISGNVKNLTLTNNKETCPFCGAWANIADGVFDVADNALKVISGPNVTKQMLAALSQAVQKAYEEKKPVDVLAKEVDKIDPSFGDLIRKTGSNKQIYLSGLLLLLMAIKSCTVEVTVDANRLIEQMQSSAPAAITAVQPPAPTK